MLQQTQVKQVIPYFTRFIQLFPDIATLAAASLDRVLKAWEGMGYYSRARNLHRTAVQIMTEYGGVFPQDMESVKNLKGIGPYTAAAILSIAFNQPYAVVDGNVRRVLCRLSMWPEAPQMLHSKKFLQSMAEKLLPKDQPGIFNEAMMELGAMVCTPLEPNCMACPLARQCRAFQESVPSAFPVKSPKKVRPHYQVAAALVWRRNELLIARRPENGLLGGLWEFPGGKQKEKEPLKMTAEREVQEELGVKIKVNNLFMVINHQYTHFTITLHVFSSEYVKGKPQPIGCSDFRWVRVEELQQYAFPRANSKIIEELLRMPVRP